MSRNIDHDNVQAELEDGVLTVTIPEKNQASAREIIIKKK